MRTRSFAALFALASPGLPLCAQDGKYEVNVLVEVRSPIPLSTAAVHSMCGSAKVQAAIHEALGDDDQGFWFCIRNGSTSDQLERDLNCHLSLGGESRTPLSPERQQAILAKAVSALESALAPLTMEPLERDRQRLVDLTQQAAELEARYLDVRRQAASLRGDLATVGSLVADLAKQRLAVELDLRTEEGVLRYLQEQLVQTQKQRDELVASARDLTTKKGQLQALVNGMQRMLNGTKPEETERARKEFDDLQQRLVEVEQALATRAPESKRCLDLLDALAADAQKATLTVQRLTTRLQLLQSVTLEQQEKLAEAEAAAAERDAVLARAEDLRAQLTAVHQRAQELRTRLADVEPLRIVRWN